jgi:hypothetical protein
VPGISQERNKFAVMVSSPKTSIHSNTTANGEGNAAAIDTTTTDTPSTSTSSFTSPVNDRNTTIVAAVSSPTTPSQHQQLRRGDLVRVADRCVHVCFVLFAYSYIFISKSHVFVSVSFLYYTKCEYCELTHVLSLLPVARKHRNDSKCV